jgi:tRNA (cytidine32/uridine32-2'-O)-methyltransferase
MSEEKTTKALGDLTTTRSGLTLLVVLVEIKDPRNIGAVARAMSNLDVRDLRLVQPEPFDRTVAKGVACWGEALIDSATTYATLAEAVSDAHEVVGFASDSSSHRMSQRILEDWVGTLETHSERTIALVFGSEERGLRREHFPLCQNLIRIPSSSENPSYNLAQSVILALYAIRRRSHDAIGDDIKDLPTSGQLEQFTEMVVRTAEQVGFLNENSPSHIEELLVNITRRGRLSTRELKVMTGLFGMIHKKLGKV